MGRSALSLLALLAMLGRALCALAVCTPYAMNTAPTRIDLAWDGQSPENVIADCAVDGASAGYRVLYRASGEVLAGTRREPARAIPAARDIPATLPHRPDARAS
jgi:hypothetical protein